MLRRLAAALPLLLLALALAGCAAPRKAASGRFAHTRGKEIVGPDGRPILLRGTNVGNWLLPEGYMFHFQRAAAAWQIDLLFRELIGPSETQAFWRAWQDAYITRADIARMRRMGMNHVRVPFSYKLFTPEAYPGVWMGPGFELLDRIIGWSKAEGLYVLLDMHAAPCGQNGENIDDGIGYPWLYESEECQQRTAEVWRRIAERYRDEPTVIGYDLLNEPIPHFESYQRLNPYLEPVYKRLTAAIREVDPHHIIFLGGAQWDTNFDVFGPPFDGNLVYSFHRYWAPPTPEGIRPFTDFRDRHNVPIWMGESGENTDAWVDSFRVTLEAENIGWSFWPYKKMDATAGIVSFPRPRYWEEIVAYEKLIGAPFDEKRKARPSAEHARAALADLLVQIRFENSRVNPGYVRALGLTPALP